MRKKNFYDIKGLGKWPEEQQVQHPKPPHQPPSRPFQDPRSRKRSHKFLLTLLIIIVMAGLGFGAYWFGKDYHSKSKPKTQTTSSANQPAPSTTNTGGSRQYISKGNDLNLSFTYPSGWTATPASGGNSNDQTITLTSPLTSITAADGSTVTGKVTVTIRPGTAPINELDSNSPMAPVASAQIAYTSPTTNQYQYPYITFIHFTTGSKTAGAFEEAMITGTTQLTAGEAVEAADLTGLDPIIAATFAKCSTKACTGAGAAPLSITSDTWNNADIFQQTLSLFESLQLN